MLIYLEKEKREAMASINLENRIIMLIQWNRSEEVQSLCWNVFTPTCKLGGEDSYIYIYIGNKRK